jgi:carboxymethylenebutenolidase
MALKNEWVRYAGGEESGYLSVVEGAKAPLPAVLVLQEAWGVDAHIEDVTRRFALAGYAALAPDLYASRGERPEALRPQRLVDLQRFMNKLPPGAWMDPKAREAELATRPADERARIEESLATMMGNVGKLASFVPRLLAATRWLRIENEVTRGQRVGSVGFCMGGGLSALLACSDADLAAAVVFYGSSPPLDLVPDIRCPVLGLYGGLDERINGGVPAFEDAMKRAGKRFERVVYEGAAHAFFNDNRPAYHVGAARDAFVRTLALFRTELAGS